MLKKALLPFVLVFVLETLIQSFTHIYAPLALIRASGQLVAASVSGQVAYQRLAEHLMGLDTCHQQPCEVSHYAHLPIATTVFMGEQIVRFIPTEYRGQTACLLEWNESGNRLFNQAFHLLRDITEAVNSSLILEDIFESLGLVLRSYIPYTEAGIALLDDTQNGLKVLVRILANGLLEFRQENHRFTGDDPALTPFLDNPNRELLTFDQSVEASMFFPPWMESGLVVPLVNKGILIGILTLASDEKKPWTQQHLQLLPQVAQPIAVAMENAKLYWQTQTQASHQFLINQLTKSIQQSFRPHDILSTAMDELGRVMGVSRGHIVYFESPLTLQRLLPQEAVSDEADNSVTMMQHPSLTPESYYPYQRNLDDQLPFDALKSHCMEWGIFCKRAQSKAKHHPVETFVEQLDIFNPFILNDVADCPPDLAPPEFFEQWKIRSLAIFPIMVGEACVGTITLHQTDHQRTWLPDDLILLRAIREHLGLALHQSELYKALEMQKVELETTLKELQQAQLHLIQSEKMAVLGQFVAGIAHEVNTPLGAIASNHQTIDQCLQNIDNAMASNSAIEPKWVSTATKLLGINAMASARIDDIVKNLRNFARLDESDLKTVALDESIDSTLLLLDSPLKENQITIIRDLDSTFPPFECFPGLLNQVLMNLIVNAIHALRDSQTVSPSITLSATVDTGKGEVRIGITDNGPGIPEHVLPKIFDPGFTTKGVGVGTGLGLALCYRIMEKHHGRIEVYTSAEAGTTMTMCLPEHQPVVDSSGIDEEPV